MFQALREESDYNHGIFRILFEHWAESDPENALEQIMANRRDKRLEEWGTLLSSQLMKHAPEIGIPSYQQLGIRGYPPDTKKVGEWARSDPKLAAELVVDQMKNHHPAWEVLKEIAKVWGESDPEAALAFGLELKDPNFRYTMLTSAMKTWTQDDPESAAAYAAD